MIVMGKRSKQKINMKQQEQIFKLVYMRCKAATTNFFTVVGLPVELSIAIKNQSVLLRHILPLGTSKSQ